MATAGVGRATAVVVGVDVAVVALVGGWSVLVVVALPESIFDRLDGSLHNNVGVTIFTSSLFQN